MTDRNKVVWSEGLFLRTQHFQQQDRHSEWLVRQALRATPLQGYGFATLKLDQAALDAGLVGIENAEGVLPMAPSLPFPMAPPRSHRFPSPHRPRRVPSAWPFRPSVPGLRLSIRHMPIPQGPGIAANW